MMYNLFYDSNVSDLGLFHDVHLITDKFKNMISSMIL